MKKYVKPELFFENYELSQQIAACDYDAHNNQDVKSCAFYGSHSNMAPMYIFQLGNTECKVIADAYCYHGSNSGFNVFNS